MVGAGIGLRHLAGAGALALTAGIGLWALGPWAEPPGDAPEVGLAAPVSGSSGATPEPRPSEQAAYLPAASLPDVSADSRPDSEPAEPAMPPPASLPRESPSPIVASVVPATPPPAATAEAPADHYPSPPQVHLQSMGQRVRTVARALALEDEPARALIGVLAQHVRSERALWDEARLYGDPEIDPERLQALDEQTLQTIRDHPEMGDGLAQAVERMFEPLVRDPGRPVDPSEHRVMSVSELRALVHGGQPVTGSSTAP